MSIMIRPAQFEDVSQIVQMVNRFAAQNIMLPRSEENVQQTISDWLVAVEQEISTTPDEDQHLFLSSTSNQQKAERYNFSTELPSAFDIEAEKPAIVSERIVGCGALVPLNDKLIEVRSLAIDESQHGKGLGSALVIHLVNMARERGYTQACALTLRPNFFIRLGFEQVDRWSISPKVWQACIYCPKFHRCDEVAVLLNLADIDVKSEERGRQARWNHLLKWGEWQPLRLAYRYEYPGVHRSKG